MILKKVGASLSLGLVALIGSTGLAYSDNPTFKESFSVTVEQMNRFRQRIAREIPMLSSDTPETTPSDLDKSQLVSQTRQEAQADLVTTPISLTTLEAITIHANELVLILQGNEPTTRINVDSKAEIITLTLQNTKLAFSVPINRQPQALDHKSLQVRQYSDRAEVEITFHTKTEDWRVNSRPGSLTISPTLPSTATQNSPSPAPLASTSDQTLSQKENPLTEDTIPSISSSSVSSSSPELNPNNPEITSQGETVVHAQLEAMDSATTEITPLSSASEASSADSSNLPIALERAPSAPPLENSTKLDSLNEKSFLSQLEEKDSHNEEMPNPPPENLENSISATDNNPSGDNPSPTVPLTPLQLSPTQLINLETANVLPQGSILTSYGAHIFSKGAYGSGTGLQTYNISIAGGITDQLQMGMDWVLFDDNLGELINGGVPYLAIINFAPKFKYQLIKEEEFRLAVLGSLEIGKFTGSYGLYTPSNLQRTSTTLGGTLQIPFTYNLTSNFQWHLVPGAIFFPNTINDGGNFYGSYFNIGTGFNYNPWDRLMLFANVNFPLAGGGNAVNNQGEVFRKPVWAAGLTYVHSPTVGVDLYATNALGSTPATQTLAFIPNGGQVAAGINVRYTPDIGQNYPTSFRQEPSLPLSERDKQLLFNGITLTSANTVKNGMVSLQGGVGPDANFQLAYGMSDNAQLEFIGQQLGNSDELLGNLFKLGVGSKLQFLNQAQGDPFSLSIRGSLETANDVGTTTAELAFLYQVNPELALTFNPKVSFWGSTDIAGMGIGLNYQIFDGLQLIGEVTPIVTGGATVLSGAIRYIHPQWNVGVDLYGTNAIGTHDVGGLIVQSNNQSSVGFNLLWMFGGTSRNALVSQTQ